MTGVSPVSVASLDRARRPNGRAEASARRASPLCPQAAAEIHRLLGAVYDGPFESSPWQTALQMLRGQLNATRVTLILRPTAQDRPDFGAGSGSSGVPTAESGEICFTAIDPAERLSHGTIGAEPGQLLAVDVRTEEGIDCCLQVRRPPTARPFSDADRAACRLVLPHLRRAIQLHARLDFLECERQLLAGTVNRMQVGIISFAEDGTPLETNPEASRMLAEKDGIWLSGNTLCVDSNQESRGLRTMIQSALGRSAIGRLDGDTESTVQAMSITRPSGRAKLGVIVRSIPLKPWSERRRRPAVVVFVRDPESNAGQPSQELVRRLFGFTPMQAQLALLLAEGLTLDEAAEQMNVMRNTARSHLRAIFHKTGVTRQTMLVRLLLNSVLTLGLEPD